MKNKIFCLLGKSSVGKDSIFKILLNDNSLNLKPIITYTTRPKRENEKDGVEYNFIDLKILEKFKKDKKIIEIREYFTVDGIWFYGVFDDGQVQLDLNNYLLITTPLAYKQIKLFWGEKNVVPLYIKLDDYSRLNRALIREKREKTGNYEELCRRFIADNNDFSKEILKNINITLENTYLNNNLLVCSNEIKEDILKKINPYSNIIFQNGRIFIDIAKNCGSGCSYCYVLGFNKKQILISEVILKESLEYISHLKFYKKGKKGSIISLCPNTEPFKSKNSIKLLMIVIKFFLKKGNPIQISTKEKIPEDVFRVIDELCIYKYQVFFNISINTITEKNKIEPYAEKIINRLKNFTIAKKYKKISTTLYIKPFLETTKKDLKLYIKILEEYKPDMICIGIDFGKTSCDFLYNDKEKKHLEININNEINNFTKEIFSITEIPIFHTSICSISYKLDLVPKLKIWKDFPDLCTKCKDCEDEYE